MTETHHNLHKPQHTIGNDTISGGLGQERTVSMRQLTHSRHVSNGNGTRRHYDVRTVKKEGRGARLGFIRCRSRCCLTALPVCLLSFAVLSTISFHGIIDDPLPPHSHVLPFQQRSRDDGPNALTSIPAPSEATLTSPQYDYMNNATFYCEWKHKGTLKQCFRIIHRSFQRHSIGRNRPWIFFGDSTMRHLFDAIIAGLHEQPRLMTPHDLLGDGSLSRAAQTNTTLLRNSTHRCGSLEYFGMRPPSATSALGGQDAKASDGDFQGDFGHADSRNPVKWVPPDHSKGEGPVAFGLLNPFCSDAAKCFNQQHLVEVNGAGTIADSRNAREIASLRSPASTTMEFLTVEFALDVAVPTSTSRTTQETAIQYLQRQRQQHPREGDHRQLAASAICVVNTGTHDMAIPNMTTELYTSNVQQYWKQLLSPVPALTANTDSITDGIGTEPPICEHIVWISLSYTKNQPSRPQRNWKLKAWNDALMTILSSPAEHNGNGLSASFLRDHVAFVDVWHKSSKTKHVDNVHLVPSEYYIPLADLFVNLTLATALAE